ncbi:uncharacterized protein LOC119093149 [Pollicipes pollicipes]|uniref:uncharacterized protein LOC119093149 n=1 Tax=Pollicipes pollicipes TaxID=41117 RepID=UPI0018858EF1|nr:uncharacterized protein LOC119093149 [Pollicipes pollicipes]
MRYQGLVLALLVVAGVAQDEGRQLNLDPLGLGDSLKEGLGHIHKTMSAGMEQLRSGLSEASRVASIVGEDMSESFSQAEGERAGAGGQLRQRESLLDGVMRMLGVDSDKLGVMALNALIYLAEWITGSLLGEKNSVDSRSGAAVLDWLMDDNVAQFSEIVQRAQQPSLPKSMIESLIDRTGNDTACVQLLICKMSPVVWGAQNAVKQSFTSRSLDGSMFDSFYEFLPSMNDFVRFSESCESQFPACPLIDVLEEGQQ